MKTFAMSNHFNPMDGFERPQDFHSQARILKEVGIDGYYYNLGRKVSHDTVGQCAQACMDEGIELAAVYWVAEVSKDKFDAELSLFLKLLESIPDNCPIELGFSDPQKSIQPSSPEGLEAATRFIEAVNPALKSKSCLLSPYPHFDFLLETVNDSLSLIRQCGGDNLKAVASAIHGRLSGEDWLSEITKAPDRFQSVSLCGISKPGDLWGYTIEPLGTGTEVDNHMTVATLRQSGYNGWIGLQGYGIRMDSQELLSKSAAKLIAYLYG